MRREVHRTTQHSFSCLLEEEKFCRRSLGGLRAALLLFVTSLNAHASCFTVIMAILPRRTSVRVSRALALVVFVAIAAKAHAYVLNGRSWPSGSTIQFYFQLGAPALPLQDGNTSWNAAAVPAAAQWNRIIANMQMSTTSDTSLPIASNDGVNTVSFSNTIFGQAFGANVLAVTYYYTRNGAMTEADVLFNTAMPFNSYRGRLQFLPNGTALNDIRRVLVHELGHAIGLNHPDGAGQHVEAVMNSVESDLEVPTADDTSGAQSLYGAPAPAPVVNARLGNISTRVRVGTGDNVMIGGFIISGSQAKKVIIRAVGPSLANYGVTGALANPQLSLHNSAGALLSQNDDWSQSAQAAEMTAANMAPANPREAAIVATLQPGSYTAIVSGVNNTTGTALVEAFEMDSSSTRMLNVSTRGNVATGDEVMIGGFIVQGSTSKRVLIRAKGPSLASVLPGTLANPTLDLRNSAGNSVATNDDWNTSAQRAEIVATNLAPTNNLESAIVATLPPGNYTAIVRGVNSGTGIGLVEVFDLE